MRHLVLLLILCAGTAQAALNIEPGVFRALEAARTAQQKGDYAAAKRALDGAKARPGSVEQTLLWRSYGYLAWAAGRNAEAIDWLDKAIASGKLEESQLADERLNLAKLNLIERRFAKAAELLAPLPANADEERLQLLAQAYQGQGRHDLALPIAERYLRANPAAADSWLQFLVAGNAELKRYAEAERWQRQLLQRRPNDLTTWRQLAGLQQLAGRQDKALATLRTAHGKGLRFSAGELDNLVLLASAADQPWQGAKLLAGMLDSGLLPRSAQREERLAQLWWQARERREAARLYRTLANRSGSGKHWLVVAQLELEQANWQAGLDALKQAERAGAERSRINTWRQWAESELSFEQERRLAAN